MSLLLSLPSRSRTLNANTSAPYLPTWRIGYHRLNIIAYYLLVCMCLFCVVGVCVCVCCPGEETCVSLSLFLLLQYLQGLSFLPSLRKKLTPISCFCAAHFHLFEKKEKKILTVRTKPGTKETRKTKLRWIERSVWKDKHREREGRSEVRKQGRLVMRRSVQSKGWVSIDPW